MEAEMVTLPAIGPDLGPESRTNFLEAVHGDERPKYPA